MAKAKSLIGSRNINRMFWIETASFASLLIFIWIDDELLIPMFVSEHVPLSPKLLTGILDSFWIFAAFLFAAYFQFRLKEKVKILEGMLPICAGCKKIRDENSSWIQIEQYINAHTHADFSHSVCPDCGIKLYGDLYLKAVGKPA
jgi:hypothetical protein